MSEIIKNLEPSALWNNFASLNEVPRASKKEERIIDFMINFGKSLGLSTIKDEVGNVIIKKPATVGMEDRKTVVLQSHLDMVHQKNNDTVFDFDTEGIKMFVEADWVKAEGTTLGADNGIGVATIMAILADTDMEHPNLEALFTIDEETGMTGAMGLQGGMLEGEILLNLDTEQDDEIDIGCAGGIDVTATRVYTLEATPAASKAFTITIKGLCGGHSGMEIHKGLGNANKLMNRVLMNIDPSFDLRIASIKGGGLRNAIPRESVAQIVINENQASSFEGILANTIDSIKNEFKAVEPNLTILIESNATIPSQVMDFATQNAFISAIDAAHNGVYKMSPDFADLVETSNNIARIIVENGTITIQCLTRSSVETSKMELANALKSTFETLGCMVTFTGDYPGWKPNRNSEILDILTQVYEKQIGTKAHVVACHAGLECGILGRNYPKMDMISFGPTILGAHSPTERVSISSVQKFWKFLVEILKNIPKKA